MSYGPSPWLQQHWDWRAAGNFMAGGAGSGLIAMTLLGLAGDSAQPWLAAAGGLLVGAGLTCVWAEIGRPLRAMRVFVNPQTSWMTREGMVGTVLSAAVVGVVIFGGIVWLIAAGLAGLAFAFCQGRMLQSAKGIPAWRERRIVALIVTTSLAEGAGLLALLALAWDGATGWQSALLALAILARIGAWMLYRRRLDGRIASPALAALDSAGSVLLLAGTLVPLALIAVAVLSGGNAALLALAGLSTAAAGAWLKFVLVTRASWNQGFAIAQVPTRGVRAP